MSLGGMFQCPYCQGLYTRNRRGFISIKALNGHIGQMHKSKPLAKPLETNKD